MPQPIKRIVKDPYVVLDTNSLADKPDMANLVCQIFATWASIERSLGGFLVHMVGASSAPAHAIFSILQAQHLQTKALEAAARSSLDDVGLEAFSACNKLIDAVQKTRNRLAHWAWGSCKERPDLLILADPKMLRERDTRTAAFFQSLSPNVKFDLEEAWQAVQFDEEHIYAYSVDDLRRDLRDLKEVEQLCTLLGLYLDPSIGLVGHPGHGEPMTAREIRESVIANMGESQLFTNAVSSLRRAGRSH